MGQTIKIGFSGDIAFSEYTKELYKNPERLDKSIYNFFNENDYNILNFESPITESMETKKAALAHKSDIESLNFIKQNIKHPILSLANNHMMDFGYKGLEDTLVNVKEAGLQKIGAGDNEKDATSYIILGDEVKVGVFAIQYKDYYIATKTQIGTAHDKHKKLIKKNIKELKKKVDWIVFIYHGGDEFLNTPMPYDRKKLKKFLKWGADIVVAHHPHTVQGYEKFKKKMIFYSLGNFIFDTNYQRIQKGTQYGELISISFDKENYEFKNLNLYNDRKNGEIRTIDSYRHFKDIKATYKQDWKRQALRFKEINNAKRELKKYRRNFSIEGLYIQKANCNNYMIFEELVKKHSFSGIDEVKKSKHKFLKKIKRKIKRKVKRITNVKYKKHICIAYAKKFARIKRR